MRSCVNLYKQEISALTNFKVVGITCCYVLHNRNVSIPANTCTLSRVLYTRQSLIIRNSLKDNQFSLNSLSTVLSELIFGMCFWCVLPFGVYCLVKGSRWSGVSSLIARFKSSLDLLTSTNTFTIESLHAMSKTRTLQLPRQITSHWFSTCLGS